MVCVNGLPCRPETNLWGLVEVKLSSNFGHCIIVRPRFDLMGRKATASRPRRSFADRGQNCLDKFLGLQVFIQLILTHSWCLREFAISYEDFRLCMSSSGQNEWPLGFSMKAELPGQLVTECCTRACNEKTEQRAGFGLFLPMRAVQKWNPTSYPASMRVIGSDADFAKVQRCYCPQCSLNKLQWNRRKIRRVLVDDIFFTYCLIQDFWHSSVPCVKGYQMTQQVSRG